MVKLSLSLPMILRLQNLPNDCCTSTRVCSWNSLRPQRGSHEIPAPALDGPLSQEDAHDLDATVNIRRLCTVRVVTSGEAILRGGRSGCRCPTYANHTAPR